MNHPIKPREHWGSRIGFLLATAGSAVGLGSLWKFPYVTGEYGGGVFVLSFLIFTFLIGVPLFMGELLIGRIALACPVKAFGELSSPTQNWRFVGWTSSIAPLFVLSFYSVVAGWALNYCLMSLLNVSVDKNPDQIRESFDILYDSAEINFLWTFLFIALTAGVVYRGVRKGIELCSKILMPLLFIFLILLLLYSMTLSGFVESVHFIFFPHWEKLSGKGLLEALGLACFTLSVGMGIIITYGSYMKNHEDVAKTAVIISLVNLIVSLLAALMIFPIIFTFNFTPSEGPGLLFKTLPILFAKLPGTLLLSTLFFLLVVFAALTSTISIMEVLVATLSELYGWTRRKSVLIASLSTFILAIPSASAGSGVLFTKWPLLFGKNFFGTIENFTFSWLLPINVLLTAIFLGWRMQKSFMRQAFDEGCQWKFLFLPWLFSLRFIVPAAILIILLQESGLIDIGSLFR